MNYTTWAVQNICARWECKNGLFKRIDLHVWQLQLYIDIGVQIAEALTHIGGKLPQAVVEVVEVVEVAEVVEVEASQVAALVAAVS